MITNRIKRGANASLPNGAAGEPLFTTDTYDLYIGKGDGTNQRYQKYMADAINGTGVANQLAYFSGANTIAGSTFLTLNLTADNGYLILTGGSTYKNADIWLNRYSDAWENAIRFQTNGTTDWYVGSSASGSNSDFEIYNYGTSANGIKIAKATNNVTVGGTLTATIGALATAATNFVTSDSGTLKSRTAAQVLSDIGAQAAFGNQTANTVFSGPTTGSAAAPTFRALVAADIPALPYQPIGNYVTLDTAQTITAVKTFNDYVRINTDTNPSNLTGKQLVLRADSGNGGQSLIAMQGYDKTTRWVLNVQDAADTYHYSLYSNSVTIGTTPSYQKRFELSQTGVLRLPNYSTNGLAAFTGGDGTISSVARTINGTTFDGSANITITANTTNAITFNDGGAGATSGTTFNGSAARTISYNTIGAQPAGNYVTLDTTQNITGSKTFRSVYGGGTGDFTDVTTPILKISPTTGFWRIPFISIDETISGVFNFQTGKNVYWGEPDDTGTYFFRGRAIDVRALTGTSAVFSSTVTTARISTGSTSPYPNVALSIRGTINGNNDTWGVYQGAVTHAPSANNVLAVGYQAGGSVNTGTFTGLSYRGFFQENLGANTGSGTLVTAYGVYISTMNRATNNYSAYFADNVGIGNDAPSFKLDVSGTLRVTGTSTLANINATAITGTTASFTVNTNSTGTPFSIRNLSAGAAAGSQLYLGNDVDANGAGFALFSSGFTASAQYRTNGGYIYTNKSGGLTLHAEGDNSLYLSTNSSTRLSINGSGVSTFSQRVGIGISPEANAQLHIYKASNAYVKIETGGGDYSYLELKTPETGSGYIIKNITTGNSLISKSLYLYNSDGPVQFVPNGATANVATIDAGGNLGIRGTIPAAWASGTEGALQIKNGGVYGYATAQVGLTANAYYNDSKWKRISATTASMILLDSYIELRTTSSSTADSEITWTTPIVIANTGEVSFTSIARSWSYSSPSTTYKNIDWGGGGVLYRNEADSYLTANCYYSTTGWKAKYTQDGGVGIWRMLGGDVAWHTYNGSVTAGSVYTLSDKFFISKAGNVGIGEGVDSFPSGDALLIKNSGVWNVTLGLQNTGTGGRKWNIFSTNDSFGQGGGKLLIYNSTGDSSAMVIDSSNNVGIQTVSPGVALDVNGRVLARTDFTVGVGTAQSYGILNVWRTTSGNSWGAIADYTNGTDMNLRINISDVGATNKFVELGSYTTLPLVLNYNQGGNVGINTITPSHKLTVRNGDIAIGNSNQTSGDFSQAQALHFLNEGTVPLATIKAVRVNWAQGRTDLTFSTYDSGMSEKVRIAYNGAVGIGTTNLTGLTGACVYIRATSTNTGQTAIAIQDYTGANRWAINGQDGASNYSFNIYSAPTGTNDFTRRLRIGQDGTFSFNGTLASYTYNFESGSVHIPGGQSGNSSAAYTAWNQLVFADQYSDVARGPNKIVTYGRGGGWVGGIGIHNDTQAYYAGGTHKFYKFDGTTATLNLSLDGSGNLTATGGFFESSDMRIKILIEDNYYVQGIDEVKPKLYTKNGKTEIGYYAQDFETILPHALSVGENGYLSLSYREVHTAKIAILEAKIKELELKLK